MSDGSWSWALSTLALPIVLETPTQLLTSSEQNLRVAEGLEDTPLRQALAFQGAQWQNPNVLLRCQHPAAIYWLRGFSVKTEIRQEVFLHWAWWWET